MKIKPSYLIIYFIFAIAFIFFLLWPTIQSTSTRIGTVKEIGLILELILIGILFLFNREFNKLIGEDKDKPKNRSLIHKVILYIFTLFLLIAFTFLFLNEINGLLEVNQTTTIAQLSVIVISLGLAGLPLAAASISEIMLTKKQELIQVSKKFILVLFLFIIAVGALYLADLGSIKSVLWADDILFWVAAPTFYGSIILFAVGMIDLPFVLFDLDVYVSQSESNKNSDAKPKDDESTRKRLLEESPGTQQSLVIIMFFVKTVIVEMTTLVLLFLEAIRNYHLSSTAWGVIGGVNVADIAALAAMVIGKKEKAKVDK